jgi:tripeptide aminopeptidase
MIIINEESITERFMRYVQIDTQSDPQSNSYPTTAKQKDISNVLVKELKEAGIKDAEMDEYGYVYATVPANTVKKNVPVICFCSHIDTAPDCSGTNVKPLLHKNFNGDDIVLPDDTSQVLRTSNYPYLKKHIGKSIITASGNTLLGADDKSGIAIIMEAMSYLVKNSSIKHGEIKVLFSPDEEVGRGTARLDIKKLGAKYGYTLDGGEAGSLEDETFNADAAKVVINGIIAHPGYGKNKLVNALKIAGEILTALPKEEWSPETTEGKEGFIHPVHMEGIAEKATIEFIVRDFELDKLYQHSERLKNIATNIVGKYTGASMEFSEHEQYRNMKEVLKRHPYVVEFAADAINRAGLNVKTESIRGGTDGSRLSYMGLPCPNIFTGMQVIHSKLEWIGVEDMVKSAETVVYLCMIWEEKS